MKFSQWLENNATQEIPIKNLIMTKEEIKMAVSNLARGMRSMTDGPLLVMQHPNKRYQLINGYHRVVEALMDGQTHVNIINQGSTNWKIPSKGKLFIPNFNLPFFGMESFIETFELKKI